MENQAQVNKGLLAVVIALGVIILAGLLWFLFRAPALTGGSNLGSMWWLISFGSGLTMIVLPCTLPLAFVIVPLSMGKGLVKGLGMALSFGAGVALMLSVYGIVAAALGAAGIKFLGAGGEDVKNWVYFFAGIFAYTFALAEIGLLKFHMPSYTGSAPDFIQKRKDFLKAFLLGLFLGNVGVGCPHPATPLLLIEIASSGNIMYGWLLFLVHAIGRVLPLIFLSLLAVLGVSGLNWLMAHKERIERATGWAMVFVAGFILTLGTFTHNWWVNSGQHNLLEMVTQEEWFNSQLNSQLGTSVAHVHGLQTGVGIFGQPLWWGNWFIVFLWVLPLWLYYRREKKRVLHSPALEVKRLEDKAGKLEAERRNMEVMLHLPDGDQGARLKEIEIQLDSLEKERRIYEESVRYGVESGMRDPKDQAYEEEVLRMRRGKYIFIALFLISTFAIFLPMWFVNIKSQEAHTHTHPVSMTPVGDAIKTLGGTSPAPATAVVDESMPHSH